MMNVFSEVPIRVELHVHTNASKDSLVNVSKLLSHCEKIGIDRVAITDHNVIEAAMAAKEMAPKQVIVGEEIETTQGELIGYFMTEWVPSGLEPEETIRRLRSQGAVISVPHPFDTARGPSWAEEELVEILPLVDAIEVFNARCLTIIPNEQAESFAREQGLLGTVGSDAHSLYEVGRASLMMQNFSNAEEFKAALADAEPMTSLSPVFVHLFSRFAMAKKRLFPLKN